MRIIARGTSNLPINVGVSRTFHARLIDQQLSHASRDLATLTFDLEGHGACRPCGVFVLRLCTKVEVPRSSLSEDIAHLLCNH